MHVTCAQCTHDTADFYKKQSYECIVGFTVHTHQTSKEGRVQGIFTLTHICLYRQLCDHMHMISADEERNRKERIKKQKVVWGGPHPTRIRGFANNKEKVGVLLGGFFLLFSVRTVLGLLDWTFDGSGCRCSKIISAGEGHSQCRPSKQTLYFSADTRVQESTIQSCPLNARPIFSFKFEHSK